MLSISSAPRRRVGSRTAALCALLICCLAAPAGGEEADWKKGKLAHLAPYIGTYRYDAILADPAVAAALDAFTGTDAARIRINLQVAAPIGFAGADLVMAGNAPHRGGLDEAIVLVRIFDGSVRAALLHEGRMTLYAPDTDFAYLPEPLRTFVRTRLDRSVDAQVPPGVIWIRQPRD